MNFKLFADELRIKLLLLGLRETDARPFEIDFYYNKVFILTIHYNYEYITSPVFEMVDYFLSDISQDYYNDLSHVNDIVKVVSKYIKSKKQESIKQKLK